MWEFDMLFAAFDEKLKETRDGLEEIRLYAMQILSERMELKRDIAIAFPMDEVWHHNKYLPSWNILFFSQLMR